jgi:hypothetical protein
MGPRSAWLLTALLAIACSKKSDGFEGEITMRITLPDAPPSEMHFETARDFARIGLAQGGGPAYALVKPDGLAVFVVESEQSWSDLNMATARSAAAAADPSGIPTITRTARHETIAGQDCEAWEIRHTSGKRTDACIAEGLVGFDLGALMPGAGPFTGSATDEVRKRRLFPLRSVELDASGKETSRMEVTRIERKSIPASRFEVPKDFTYVPKK